MRFNNRIYYAWEPLGHSKQRVPNVELMLGQRLRRWPNMNSALGHVMCLRRWLATMWSAFGPHGSASELDIMAKAVVLYAGDQCTLRPTIS